MAFLTIVFTVMVTSALVLVSAWVYTLFTDTILINRKNTIGFTAKRYLDSKSEQIECSECKGTLFYVGQDRCLTAVICTSCLSEEVIHTG